MPTLLEFLRETSVSSLFEDANPVDIRSGALAWLRLPNDDFLGYARSLRRASYDALPERADLYRPDTTFLHAQAHRIWLTLKKLSELLPLGPASTLLNLGAFPFAIDFALRDYLKHQCNIISTINQDLSDDLSQALRAAQVRTIPVNLDPYVVHGDAPAGQVDYLPLPDSSVDCVLFAHVVEHLYHPFFILKESCRVLKPGGRILVTTDNAFLLSGLLEFIGGCRVLHEPIEGTAAMNFHSWRGHVRFYSSHDLSTMLSSAGLLVEGMKSYEVIYNSVPEEYFLSPTLNIPAWRADLLARFPQYRNEIFVWARKPFPVSD